MDWLFGFSVAVSWDGRILKHCTSKKAERDPGSVMYGTFFAGKKRIVSFGTKVVNNGIRADDDGNFKLSSSDDDTDSSCSLSEEWSNGVDAPLCWCCSLVKLHH